MNRLKRKQIDRPRAFWGALISAGFGIINSMNQAERAKKEAQRQANIQDYNNLLTSAPYQAQALNAGQDYQQNYLQQFKQQARLGTTKRLGSRNIMITDGGNATKIGNDTYLLRGGSHEQTNETGQTGIGINVGGNEIEAEGGEVAQKKNGALRIFSAQPILGNGMSPAQAILRGYNKDKVFSQQQAFKKRNGLKDDGNKARHGTDVPYKRIHINEDGTFTDTLTGKVYNTSATNGEDVVITGKANHWKEAGKKDTSSYYDPNTTLEFINAATAPISNFIPSNIVGSIREARDYNTFMNSFMNQDNTGFFTREYAKEHPYISNTGNFLGDLALFSFPYNKASKINNIESLGKTVKSLTPSNKLEVIDTALATGIGTIPGDMFIADSYNRTKGGKKATFIDNLEFYGGMGLSTLGAVLGHNFSVGAFNLGKSAIGRTTYDVLFKPTQTLQAAKNGLYHINKEVTANKVGQAFMDGVYSGFDDYYKNYANSTQQYFMEGKYPGIKINTRNPNDRKIIVKLYPEENELNEYAHFSDKFISPSGLDEYVTFATKSPTTNLPMMPSLKYYKGTGAHESLHGQLHNTIGANPLSKYDIEANYFRGNPDTGIDFSSWENEASTNWSKSIEELEAEFFNYKAKNNLEGKFKDLTKAQQQEFIDLASKRFKVSKNGIRNGMSILNKYFDTVMPKVK